MTFTSHENVGNAPDATYDVQKSIAEYSVRWRLFTSDADDEAEEAITYVLNNIARRGDHYQYGNGEDVSAKLSTIVPKREQGDTKTWIATLTYKDPDRSSGDGTDGGGGGTSNPLDFAPEVEVQTVQYQRPVDEAIYRGGFTGTTAAELAIGTKHPIVNSVPEIFDPPIMRDDHRMVIRILRNVAAINCNEIRANVVNSEVFDINYRGIGFAVGPRNGKIRDVTVRQAEVMIDGSMMWYVKVQLFIDIAETWWHEVLDRGFHARARVGDPNGKNGTIYAVAAGQPEKRNLTDTFGLPVNSPVLLDGDGQPLVTEADPFPDPVWTKWEDYEEVDFKTWGIFSGIIS